MFNLHVFLKTVIPSASVTVAVKITGSSGIVCFKPITAKAWPEFVVGPLGNST